jgi:nucleoside-diphosphate-sugar epimerase
MRIFLTGATGFIGAQIVPELLQAGHQVLGLTRSDSGAEALRAAGADVHRGSLEDLSTLTAGAAQADAVIHCAFDHDFSKFVANCEKDKRAIESLADALAGSARPLVITSGVALGTSVPGEPANEDVFDRNYPHPRIASELAGLAASERGVNVSVVRLPQVHDTRKQGLISYIIPAAREKGVSAYIGDGLTRLSAAHVLDVARLYRLAVERAEPGARYNAVAEEGVLMRDIAKAIATGLNIPLVSLTQEEAAAHFGWMSMFAALDFPASSAITRSKLDWQPTGPALLTDLANMDYSIA